MRMQTKGTSEYFLVEKAKIDEFGLRKDDEYIMQVDEHKNIHYMNVTERIHVEPVVREKPLSRYADRVIQIMEGYQSRGLHTVLTYFQKSYGLKPAQRLLDGAISELTDLHLFQKVGGHLERVKVEAV